MIAPNKELLLSVLKHIEGSPELLGVAHNKQELNELISKHVDTPTSIFARQMVNTSFTKHVMNTRTAIRVMIPQIEALEIY